MQQNKTKKKKKEMKPYNPFPYKKGHEVLRTYEENFVDDLGNKAIMTKCDFLDKKRNINEGYILRVKWLEDKLEFSGSRKQDFINAWYKVDQTKYLVFYDGFLMYFFNFEGKNYFSYFWDEEVSCQTYMVFELDDSLEIPNNEKEDLYFGENYEEIITFLVDNGYIKNYLTIKDYRYQSEKVIEGNKARLIFNIQFKKYCNREIDYLI